MILGYMCTGMRTKVRRSVRSMRLTALSLSFDASMTGVRHAAPKCKCCKNLRAGCKPLCVCWRKINGRNGSWVKQRYPPNHSNEIAGDGWLQDANCSSGAACADVRRPEQRNVAWCRRRCESWQAIRGQTFQYQCLLSEIALSVCSREVVCVWHIRSARP